MSSLLEEPTPNPPAYDTDSAVQRRAYIPTDEGRRLLLWQASRQAISRPCHPSGWLQPRSTAGRSTPLLVAESTSAAVSLLRATLLGSTLLASSWDTLNRAAVAFDVATWGDKEGSASSNIGWSGGQPPITQGNNRRRRRQDIVDSSSGDSNVLPPDRRASNKRRRGEGFDNGDDDGSESDRTDKWGANGADSADGADEEEDTNTSPGQGQLVHPALAPPNAPTTGGVNAKRLQKQAKLKRLVRHRANGLIPPPPHASRTELAAYESIAPKDEPYFSWLLSQTTGDPADGDAAHFYYTANSPYHTASTMLRIARAVGHGSTKLHTASFIRAWRESGSPCAIVPALEPIRGDSPDHRFLRAWQSVTFCEGQMAAVHIQYRWAMALLARHYEDKVADLARLDPSLAGRPSQLATPGGRLETLAKRQLFQAAYPNACTTDYDYFRKRLQRAMRWYNATRRLGWGILCLFPFRDVSNTWVEQTLRVSEWDLWLRLVEKVNPDVLRATKSFTNWLGPSNPGGPIASKELLAIEANIGELGSSEDSGDGIDSDRELGHFLSSQASGDTRVAKRQQQTFRQLTLEELFRQP
jgi:hypothetical protein